MIQQIKYGNSRIVYSIKKSKRRKTSEIHVDKKSVEIIVPETKSLSEIKKMVEGKRNWILQRQSQLRQEKPGPTYQNNTTVPYLGKNYKLVIKLEQKSDGISKKNSRFVISLRSKRPSKKKTKLLYESWILENSQSILHKAMVRYSRKVGVKPKKIQMKKLRSKWGSLSNDNTININLHLLKADQKIVDYIILHEICHLKIKQHSHHFWSFIEQFDSTYRDKVEWLNNNGKSILS